LFLLLIFGYIGWEWRTRSNNRKLALAPGFYKGKTVVITGASSGIGESLAIEYAKLEANLCICARRIEELNKLKPKLIELGAGEVLTVRTDVSVRDDCKNLIEETIQKFGGIDILVLNAGKSTLKFFEEFESTDEFRDYMNVNYFGCVDITFYALPHLRKSKDPKIVAISSLTGLSGVPRRTLYSPTKHAVRGFFDSLRFEIGDDVQITVVSPGYVITEIHNEYLAKSSAKRETGKFITAETAAKQIVKAEQERVRNTAIPLRGQIMATAMSFVPYFVIKYIMKKEAVPFKENE